MKKYSRTVSEADVLLHCDEATRKVVFLLGKNRKSAMENIDK